MINFSRESIEIGGSGGGAPPPNGYNPEWLPAPATTDTTVNGKTDALYMLCNVLDTGNRNYFSCNASGNYTVNVYTGINGTLISTQNVTDNVQASWQIDYAACTHQLDALTRQAYVEIVPQSGQVLSALTFNTNHPAETNTNTSANFISVIGVLPALTNATNMFYACYALQSVALPNLPALTNATSMFYNCYALQSVTLPNLPALTNATSMFGTANTETTCLRSLRKLLISGCTRGFSVTYGALQAPEINELFTSLGAASGAQTIDIRNQPGSATCNFSIAVVKGYTVVIA